MFSRLQPVLQRADSELRTRFNQRGDGSGNNGDGASTQSEIDELRTAADTLRRQLHRIVDNEIASNNEACGVATNGMLMLRNDLENRRRRRDELLVVLDEAKHEKSRMEDRCDQEEEQRETCREDVIRMQEDAERARKEAISLRAEMKQMTYFQEVLDETKHRLRADVQNLELDRERDQIRLRHLNDDRHALRTELEMLKAERDALQVEEDLRRKELSEARMTQDMYQAHQEALSLHLQHLGGDPRSHMLESFHRLRGFLGRSASLGRIKPGERSASIASSKNRDNSNKPRCEYNLQQQRHERPILDGRAQCEKSKHSSMHSSPHQHVGGIVLGADTAGGGESSDFLRKLPTIFKMGNGNNDGGGNVQEYFSKRDLEVEFISDSHSISAISAITIDEDAWSDSSSEEPS